MPHLCNFRVPQLVPGTMDLLYQHYMVAFEMEAGNPFEMDELVALGCYAGLMFASLRVVVTGTCRPGHLLLLVLCQLDLSV